GRAASAPSRQPRRSASVNDGTGSAVWPPYPRRWPARGPTDTVPTGAVVERGSTVGMPSGIGIIDTMIGFPHQDMAATYAFITRQTKDRESQEQFEFPVEYMFKDVPERGLAEEGDPISVTLREMDRWGVERGRIHVGDVGAVALKQHPDRFIASTTFDPNLGMDAIRQLVREYETFGVRAVTCFPAGTLPQLAINDKKMYPLYAKCVELGVPVFCCAGVP